MSEAASPVPRRIAAIDIARGVALLAMASFHFSWDLEFFGYLDPGTTGQGLFRLYARAIASSFLFLVGVSLVLGHRNGIRWNGFWRRLGMVAGAAALISAGTFFAIPEEWIFFGILHQIAFASLAGLLFLRAPVPATLACAAAVIAAPAVFRADVFNLPALWWVGLSSEPPRSNDYVPVFPWFGVVLLGVAAARLADRAGVFSRIAGGPPRGAGFLAALGRHSLLFYLAHQPILIGGVWLYSQALPPRLEAPELRFTHACERSCAASRDDAFCVRYCGCLLDGIKADGLIGKVFGDTADAQTRAALEEMAGLCTGQAESGPAMP